MSFVILSSVTLSVIILSVIIMSFEIISILFHINSQLTLSHYAQCRVLFVVMLSVVMLSVIMLSVFAFPPELTRI
jgi:hypothetical protein